MLTQPTKLPHDYYKQKHKAAPQQKRGYYLNEGKLERIVRKRKRKSTDQLSYLNYQFEVDPHWSKEILHNLTLVTGLSEGQVYKWGWD